MRALFAGVLGLVAFAAACGSANQGPVAGEEFDRMRADHVVYGLRHYLTANGIRQALLEADTAFVYEDSALTRLRQVHLTLYGSNGENAAILTSLEGEHNERTEAMIARGNVVLITVEGDRRIETEELHYDPRQGRIWSEVATTLTEAGRVMQGDGFNAEIAPEGGLRNTRVIRPRGQVEELKIDF
jgi:LPS export ABC transporter protein LptC